MSIICEYFGKTANNEDVLAYFSKLTNSKHNWVDRCNHAISAKPRYAVTDYAHQAGFLKK